MRKCEYCGKWFTPNRETQKYCDVRCRLIKNQLDAKSFEYQKGYTDGGNQVIDQVIKNSSQEYQPEIQDTMCTIWLSELEKLKRK